MEARVSEVDHCDVECEVNVAESAELPNTDHIPLDPKLFEPLRPDHFISQVRALGHELQEKRRKKASEEDRRKRTREAGTSSMQKKCRRQREKRRIPSSPSGSDESLHIRTPTSQRSSHRSDRSSGSSEGRSRPSPSEDWRRSR